jgi:hypothetical protein
MTKKKTKKTKEMQVTLPPIEAEQTTPSPKVEKAPPEFDFTYPNVKDTIIKNYLFWRLIYNNKPYKLSVASQTMLVPKRRVARFEDLRFYERWTLPGVLKKVISAYRHKWGSCFLFLRQQTEGSSVPQHLHFQFLWDEKEVFRDFSTEDSRMEFKKFDI